MRRSGRNDAMLLVGVTAALLVILQRPIRTFLEYAHGVEQQYGLAIVPGLVILGIVITVNVLLRRSDALVDGAIERVTADERTERTVELGRLVGLGRSLSTARSMDGLRDALRRYLPEFAHIGGVWALVRTGGKWEAVSGGLPGSSHRASPVLEALADRVLQLGPETLEDPEGAEWEGHICFPMLGCLAFARPTRRAATSVVSWPRWPTSSPSRPATSNCSGRSKNTVSTTA